MKLNKTFKKSISIILTVIMILSTFSVAIVPAGAADISENTSSADTYYFWYSEGVDNINKWTKKIQMTANGDNTYYCELQVNTGNNWYFTINKSSTSPKSTPWSSGNDISRYVTYDSSVNKSSNGTQNYDGCNFVRMSLATAQKLKFTFTPTKTVNVSVSGSTPVQPTNPPVTTTNWYITGRFAINGGGHTGANVGDWDATSKNIQLTDTDGDGIYTIDTGYTESELSAHTDWYIRLYDGTSQYGPSADLTLVKDQKYTPAKGTDRSYQIIGKTGTSGTVELCYNATSNQFYYTVDAGTTPTEKTWYLGGQVAIKDSNGNLKWASGVENTNSAHALTSQLPFTKVTDTSYKLETGLTLTEYTKYQTRRDNFYWRWRK